VALAGPAVNMAIAAVCFGVLTVLPGLEPALTLDPRGGGVVNRFMTVNLVIAAFNLLPAFPMDGGRALRALLAERMDYVKATETAATLGQGLALIFGLIGLLANPFLLFIALFVWMGASGEASTVVLRTALAGIPVDRAMITEFHALEADRPIRDAADLLLAGSQQDFPIVDHDRLVGVLARASLMRALAHGGLEAPIRTAMTTEFETADAREMLEPAFQRLQACHCPLVPVLRAGRLVGILTSENVGEFVMIRNAIAPRSHSS
jgi:CBS domain-containing protein